MKAHGIVARAVLNGRMRVGAFDCSLADRRSWIGYPRHLDRQRLKRELEHRRVTDEMLALGVLRLNLTPRTSLKRAHGRSPYEALGVTLGDKGKRWFDVLLDSEAALGLVA